MALYEIVLDESASYLIETNKAHGYSFPNACSEIVDYTTENKYKVQSKNWKKFKSLGEDTFRDFYGKEFLVS